MRSSLGNKKNRLSDGGKPVKGTLREAFRRDSACEPRSTTKTETTSIAITFRSRTLVSGSTLRVLFSPRLFRRACACAASSFYCRRRVRPMTRPHGGEATFVWPIMTWLRFFLSFFSRRRFLPASTTRR